MHPISNRPANLYGTAKMHKFEHPPDITKKNIKFRPIIYQTGYAKMSIQLMTLKDFLRNFQLYDLWKQMKRILQSI